MDTIRIIHNLTVNNKVIRYTDSGKGTVIVLLHGYLESLDVWSNFATRLSKHFRVVCFDIPGHGQSDALVEKQTMEQLAVHIREALHLLNIDNCFLVGHSMGGYLSLMFHKLFPEMLFGFCLFHSHPFADSQEKQKNRLREIELVCDGKKTLIASVNIPNTYATENVHKFAVEIEKAKDIVNRTPDKGIIANLYAMMTRPNLSESLAGSKIPFLYIVGKKDNLIDFETIVPAIHLPEKAELIVLENSGHIGFIEEQETSLSYIKKFIDLKIN